MANSGSLYEIGFLPMWETSVSHDHCSPPFNLLDLGTIHLKMGEKESIMSQSIQDREICMDTHDGFLYSPTFAYMR